MHNKMVCSCILRCVFMEFLIRSWSCKTKILKKNRPQVGSREMSLTNVMWFPTTFLSFPTRQPKRTEADSTVKSNPQLHSLDGWNHGVDSWHPHCSRRSRRTHEVTCNFNEADWFVMIHTSPYHDMKTLKQQFQHLPRNRPLNSWIQKTRAIGRSRCPGCGRTNRRLGGLAAQRGKSDLWNLISGPIRTFEGSFLKVSYSSNYISMIMQLCTEKGKIKTFFSRYAPFPLLLAFHQKLP